MHMRFGFFLMVLVAGFGAQAQRDSVLLKAVTVYGLPEEKYLAGSRVLQLDSTLRRQQISSHLGEFLSFQFPIYFRNYGNGMSSGISMRGTSPQHVAVRWNGININSFSLGQADFSLLPAVAFDDVKVHVGGASARFGSGAFGGSVLLSSANDQNHPVSFIQEMGSFGRYFTSLRGAFGVGKLSSSSSFYRLQSKNNFPIPGSDERQDHASFLQQGFIQHLQYNLSASRILELNYWYHDADREIQPTIGSANNTDTQADRNHRVSFSYVQNNRYGLLKVGGGIVDDKIIYNGMKSEIFRWITSASHQYTFSNRLNVSLNAEWNHIIGKMEAYGTSEPVEDRIDLSGSMQKSFRKVSIAFNLRQPFVSSLSAPLLPYLGVDVVLVENALQRLTLSANGSRNFRAPTMNDRYWLDAGRKDLQPESSYAAEVGLHWRYQALTFNASGFGQRIDEWIQWVPEASGVYRPENVKKVSINGFETGVEGFYTAGEYVLRGKINYQFARSITKETHAADQSAIGKQLTYTPVHTVSATIGSTFKTWSSSFFLQYSGTRYTEASNSAVYALDPFVLVDFSIGKLWTPKRHGVEFQLQVKNLLNTNYQLYSGRAMPGRNYSIKVLYQLNRIHK